MAPFRSSRRVEFADTDMAGIVHFARFFVFMEDAEHRFWNTLGLSVHTEVDGLRIGWPRVRAACDYLHPVRFEDVLDITLRLVRLGNRSLAWSCLFECGGETVARAELVTVCCRIAAGAAPVAIDIPASLARRLGGLLEEGSSDGE